MMQRSFQQIFFTIILIYENQTAIQLYIKKFKQVILIYILYYLLLTFIIDIHSQVVYT